MKIAANSLIATRATLIFINRAIELENFTTKKKKKIKKKEKEPLKKNKKIK